MANNDSLNSYLKENLLCIDVISSYENVIKKGKSYLCNCPFHKENTPSLSISPKMNIWKCFGCNQKGNAISFIMKKEKLDYFEALNLAKEKFNLSNKFLNEKINSWNENAVLKNKLIDEMNSYVDLTYKVLINQNNLIDDNEKTNVLDYLSKRKVTTSNIELFKIGYVPKNGLLSNKEISKNFSFAKLQELGIVNENNLEIFKGRIIFPLKSIFNDKIIGIAGRSIDGSEPKYLISQNSKIFEKGNSYFGYFKDEKTNICRITEGIFDEISLFNLNVANSFCLMGTSISNNQIDFLKRKGQELVVIMLDNDKAGIDACENIAEKLYDSDLSCFVVSIPQDYKDVNEYHSKEHEKVIDHIFNEKNIESFNEWIIKNEFNQLNKNSTKAEKIVNVKKALKRINTYSYDVFSISGDLHYLSKLYDLPVDYLKTKIKVFQNKDNKKLWMVQEKFEQLEIENEILKNEVIKRNNKINFLTKTLSQQLQNDSNDKEKEGREK